MSMFIPASGGVTGPPIVTGPGDLGHTTYRLIGPDGATVDLQDLAGGFTVAPGGTGLDMPPMSLFADEAPLINGSVPRGSRYTTRRVLLPLNIGGGSRAAMRANRDRLNHLLASTLQLDPTTGKPTLGTLVVRQPNAATGRKIGFWYGGGLEGDRSSGVYQVTRQKYPLTLICPDPFWYDEQDTILTFQAGSAPGFFPLFPLVLAGTTMGTQTVVNPGDADAYPVWTINGPGVVITLSNNLTGQTFVATLSGFINGSTAILDTKAGTFRDGAGSNLWPYVTQPTSSPWALRPGSQSITVNVTGFTTGQTQVVARFSVPRLAQ